MNKRGFICLWVVIAAMVVVWSCGGSRGSGVALDSDAPTKDVSAEPQAEVAAPSSDKHGTFTDPRDGKTYRTVVMPDGKTWMADNLNYDTADGTGSWCYDNDVANCAKYGRFYDWNTARAACPVGWRLPDTSDWEALVNAVGGKEIAGTKLKSRDGWNSDDSDYKPGTDEYGFSALPGGHRWYDGEFKNVGYYGYWWSATENDMSLAWLRFTDYYSEYADRGCNDKNIGFPVRCIRDD